MYLSFYGLREEPFSTTPDPAFLFLSSQHEEAYFSLLYGIRARKGFMELTGPVGTGKTTVYRALLSSLGDEVKSALILNPSLSPAQLIETVVEDFGIPVVRRTRKSYFDALNAFLVDVAKNGSSAVLVLDEAQNLKPKTMEEIRLLSNFESDKKKLLQIILVGQPELRDLLDRPTLTQVRQRIAVSVDIRPLNRDETEAYIAHRIRVAGGTGMLIFDTQAIDEIYRYSGGIPRLINSICDRALLLAYLRETGQTFRSAVLSNSSVAEAIFRVNADSGSDWRNDTHRPKADRM
ncbi:MAG: AAA family ATPase [Kiritimatiellae bacterium]|nr:AAA family ATPase [Kiritimatiellia bacterium]